MALFKRRSDNPDQVQALRAEIEAMGVRLAEADARARSAEVITAAPTPGRDIDSLIERIQSLANQLADVDARIASATQELHSKIDQSDARMTAVSNELAAQIDEVGRDGANVEELREAQVRLAAEQARYQIQFQQDLAELADRYGVSRHSPDE